MNVLKALAFVLLLSVATLAQTEFRKPWLDAKRPFILDAYGPNKLDFNELAKEPRVKGIIHQATKCSASEADPKGPCTWILKDEKYANRKAEALRRGYLWGSYHFGRTGISAKKQADEYLDTVKPADSELIALDVDGAGGNHMTLPEAEEFINRIFEKTGRYPVLYTLGKVVPVILRDYGPNSVFAKTPLWYVRYCNDVSCFFDHGRAIWPTYTLMQFASEQNCPSRPSASGANCHGNNCPRNKCPLASPIPGTLFDMDVNIFNGTTEELMQRWPLTYREGSAQ